MSQNHNADPSVEAGVIVETELKEPDMYRVLLHNDDYTQMDFVVQVLVEIFRKSNEEAVAIMMSVHNSGSGVCGVYPREIAEFRVSQVERRAKDADFPLLCTMEKD